MKKFSRVIKFVKENLNDGIHYFYLLLLDLKNSYIPSIIIGMTIAILFSYKVLKENEDYIGECRVIFIAGISLVCIVFITYYIAKKIREIAKKEKQKNFHRCKNCSSDYKKYLFTEYGLVDLNEDIILKEKLLRKQPKIKKIKVYNYTTLTDTFIENEDSIEENEDKLKNIIKRNREKGITYKIFYTANKDTFETERNVDIYGKENLFHLEIDPIYSSANFDIILYITPSKRYGYATINFSIEREMCPKCPEKRKCEAFNDNFFYKILDRREIDFIYNKLHKKLKK